MALRAVQDLKAALQAIRSGKLKGEGVYPVVYRVNARLELYAEPRWLQSWTPRHPEAR